MSEIITTLVAETDPPAPDHPGTLGRHRDAAQAPLGAARLAIERHGGQVSQTSPTRIEAVFSSASDAVAAAGRAQQAAHARAAGASQGLRIGIDVAEVGGDGPSIAERLAREAEDGQILATALVRGLVGRNTSAGFDPIDAGADDDRIDAFSVPWEPTEEVALRVAIADDAALIRSGLVQLLSSAGFVVTAEAADAEQLVIAVDAEPPDLVITDIRMPPSNTDEGLRAAAEIRSSHPDVAVLVLSQHIEARAAASLLDGKPAGIGYLLKERVSDLDEFVSACTEVAGGGSVIDPIVAEQLVVRQRHNETLARLSDRERGVLELMARGRSNNAIAAELYIGKKTVETHVRSILQKLDIEETPDGNRRVQAVLQWLESRSNAGR